MFDPAHVSEQDEWQYRNPIVGDLHALVLKGYLEHSTKRYMGGGGHSLPSGRVLLLQHAEEYTFTTAGVALAEESLEGGTETGPEELDDLVRLSQVAPLTGLSVKTLKRYVHKGKRPSPDVRADNGQHVFLIPPEPIPLIDGVLAIAAIVAQAFKAAAADVADCGAAHAFRTAGGDIAKPGEPGAVELIPRGTVRPALGWPIALLAAGEFAARGGGVILDAFADQPTERHAVPRCDADAWRRFLDDARRMARRKSPVRPRPVAAVECNGRAVGVGMGARALDALTRDFLDGRTAEGARNAACFAAACNLLARGPRAL